MSGIACDAAGASFSPRRWVYAAASIYMSIMPSEDRYPNETTVSDRKCRHANTFTHLFLPTVMSNR